MTPIQAAEKDQARTEWISLLRIAADAIEKDPETFESNARALANQANFLVGAFDAAGRLVEAVKKDGAH